MTNNTTPIADSSEAKMIEYVHPIPDHCDRIVWRGRYFGLPLSTDSSEAGPVQIGIDRGSGDQTGLVLRRGTDVFTFVGPQAEIIIAALSAPVGEPWPEPKVTNPDIANPTGIPYIDGLIHRLLDAQQDINFEANTHMSQSLCDASALIDEVETAIRKLARAHPPAPAVGTEDLRAQLIAAFQKNDPANVGRKTGERLADVALSVVSGRCVHPVGAEDVARAAKNLLPYCDWVVNNGKYPAGMVSAIQTLQSALSGQGGGK